MREFDALLRRKNELSKDNVRLACLAGGLAASAIYGAMGATKENHEPFTVMDFMPKDEKETEPDPDKMLEQVTLLADMFGGNKVVKE